MSGLYRPEDWTGTVRWISSDPDDTEPDTGESETAMLLNELCHELRHDRRQESLDKAVQSWVWAGDAGAKAAEGMERAVQG